MEACYLSLVLAGNALIIIIEPRGNAECKCSTRKERGKKEILPLGSGDCIKLPPGINSCILGGIEYIP